MKSPGHCADTGDYDVLQWDVRQGCEVRQVLDRVADNWSLLVIALLDRRTLRFSELRRAWDSVSQRMLSVTLRQLERDGLVLGTVRSTVPARVDYALTPLGVSLHDTMRVLVTWTDAHQPEIAEARGAFDRRHAGEPPLGGSADRRRPHSVDDVGKHSEVLFREGADSARGIH